MTALDIHIEGLNVKDFENSDKSKNIKYLLHESISHALSFCPGQSNVWKEQNPELRVQEGDRVRIEFTSTKGFHDWRADEFNVATTQVKDGGSTSVEFVANKKGVFEYYCGIGQHRANGMKGKLVVE